MLPRIEDRLTLELLIKRNAKVLDYYAEAVRLWQEVLRDPHIASEEWLESTLAQRQEDFEKRCGGQRIGREIMGLTGIGQFMSGHLTTRSAEKRQNARRVYRAICIGMCAVEVQKAAEVAFHMFEVYDYESYLE